MLPAGCCFAPDDLRSGPARFLDLFLGRLCKAMGRNLECLRNLAVSEDHEIVLGLFDKAAFVKNFRSDLVARAKILFDLSKADLDPLLS